MVNRTGRRSVLWSEVERALRAADYPEDSMGTDEDHLRYTGRAEAVAIIRDMLSMANADDAHPAATTSRSCCAEALEQAADAWDDPANSEDLRTLAREKYRAGGPSMPSIWLRERAQSIRAQADA